MGRPKEEKNSDKLSVIVEPSRCPKCNSAERSQYSNTVKMDFNGTFNGHAYKQIVWRTCWCKDCGQIRRDKSYI